MVADTAKYVTLDKTNHIIGEASYTVCYLELPYNTPYTTDRPDKVCKDCSDKYAKAHGDDKA